jgi:putative FmdB family regulatory protein
MALYEYLCGSCGTRFEKRMPMSNALQVVSCTSCGKQARKVIGQFAVVGRAEAGFGDGPAPWDDGGEGGGDEHGHSHDHGHGHSHGDGGHSHGWEDDLDL